MVLEALFACSKESYLLGCIRLLALRFAKDQ
jgi:hypothetical protein